MKDLTVSFERPLLMLLLIPALALTLLTYFLINKKYRRTRNRIVSMVLHMIVMTLCICVVSGLKFEYVIPNEENEIVLLVDVSDTTEESVDARDEFLQTVISESKYDGYKVGVVTFGFTQEYAVPLTYDTDSIFERYHEAPLPDTSATDIAAALKFTRSLFTHPESSKIVLISDGKETDEEAMTVIRSISAQGTRVDTVNINSDYGRDNVQVVGVQYPDYHLTINKEFDLGVEISSRRGARSAVINIYDNGRFDSENGVRTMDITGGSQIVNFRLKFAEEGLHEIKVELSDSDDGLNENNNYCSYYYLEVYDQVLVIDQGKTDNESSQIKSLLEKGEADGVQYDVEELHLASAENVPDRIDDLLVYDQIILNNIASSDLTPYGLDELLYSYVYEYGGGLFTTGGYEIDSTGQPKRDENNNYVAHAYNRFDLRNTLLQQMLPVQAINYTPPVGVVVVVDVSGSMGSEDNHGRTRLDWAKGGATTCLQALTERDYMSVIALNDSYSTAIQLTACTEQSLIQESIRGLTIAGGTLYHPAITRAGQALIAEKRVDRRHVVIISDGYPGEKDEEYLPEVRRLFETNNITFSVIGIDMDEADLEQESSAASTLYKIAHEGGGNFFVANDEFGLYTKLLDDLNAPEIKELKEEDFHPVVASKLSPIVADVEFGRVEDKDAEGNVVKTTSDALSTTLKGFYGVKARERAETILVGEYEVPIYAQWKFGQGMVGSFMSDLSGHWSSDLLADENGQKLLLNIVATLMPTSNIRPNAIRISLEEENYINELNILTTLEEGEILEGTITKFTEDGEVESVTSLNEKTENADGDLYVTVNMNAENRYTRSVFILKASGVFKITVTKKDKDGNICGTAEIYKSFSYSKEYDAFTESEILDTGKLMEELAAKGNGAFIDPQDPWSIFRDFVTGIEKTVDPTLAFMIVAAILFLLDIAVRKFKFKWPHELVRSYKERKATKK